MGVASSPDSCCYEISVLFHLLLTIGELSTHVLFLGANRDEAVFSLTSVRMDKLAKMLLVWQISESSVVVTTAGRRGGD